MLRRAFILILAARLTLPVYAGPGRGPGPGFGGAPHGHGGFDWFGLALFGAIATLIFVGDQTRAPQPMPQPDPVYVENPGNAAPPANNANTWYYCGSSGKYYPYT